ncbi:MAG: hypothetical protein KIT36_02640 [Alphaproteobacteria bacterium]|nr:hypothetical protein [Alphaproteobacteria bacterium]
MRLDWSTLALQTVNFAVLAWLLYRFLYRPVLRMIDARRAEVQKQYDDTAKIQADVKARLAEIEAERSGIVAERTATLKAAAAQAEELAAARRSKAEREAGALMDATRRTLAREREEALAEARRSALDLGVDVARRLLSEIPMESRAAVWLDRIEHYLAGLDEPRRREIGTALDGGGVLRVVTAAALPEGVAAEWRRRLARALGDGLDIEFDTDPALVAGAELHFPHAILRFSWRSALDAMRTEIEGHDNAG